MVRTAPRTDEVGVRWLAGFEQLCPDGYGWFEGRRWICSNNIIPLVMVGNRKTTIFWKSTWTGEAQLRTEFRTLFNLARCKNRKVTEALNNDQWVLDLRHENPMDIA